MGTQSQLTKRCHCRWEGGRLQENEGHECRWVGSGSVGCEGYEYNGVMCAREGE